MNYPYMIVDVCLLAVMALNTALLARLTVHGSAKIGPLTVRVGALEERMGRVEQEMRSVAAVPAQLHEVHQLLRQALEHQQGRQNELEAQQIIDAESRKELAATLAAQQRTFGDLSRVMARLACLSPDPVLPCPGEKA